MRQKRQDAPSDLMVAMAAELADELGVQTASLAGKHLPAVPTVKEVRTLLDCAKSDPCDYLMLRIFYYSGIRLGELAALRFADVFDDNATIFVRSGKGDRDRYCCLDRRTLELIRRWQGDRPDAELVIGKTPAQIESAVVEYGRLAGLVQKYEAMERSFSPHSLRHAMATHRYDAGMDLAVLKKLLGHEFVSTTLIYVETSMRQAQKEYRKTDPLRGR